MNTIPYRYIPIELREVVWRAEKIIVVSYKPLQSSINHLNVRPGHFVLFWVPKHEAIPLVPIPLSKDIITFIVKSKGSTTQLLVKNPPGKAGIIGPLGAEIELSKLQGNILLVGGGTGIATILSLTLFMAKHNSSTTLVYGARDSSELIPIDKIFHKLLRNINTVYFTEDGSIGSKGKVTDIFNHQDISTYDTIIAVGPIPMLCNIYHIVRESGYLDKLLLGLETLVRCGMGFCGSCIVRGENVLLCREGPIFRAIELQRWADLQCEVYAVN